jgi:hypothetical protein
VLVGTAGHFAGLPATWDIVTPDLTGATAFNNAWMPMSGQSTSYLAQAFAGREDVLFGAVPNPGESIKQAYRITLGVLLLRMPGTEAHTRRAPLFPQYLRR